MSIELHPCRKMASVPKTQWAAVSTKASLMSEPPQELRPKRKMRGMALSELILWIKLIED